MTTTERLRYLQEINLRMKNELEDDVDFHNCTEQVASDKLTILKDCIDLVRLLEKRNISWGAFINQVKQQPKQPGDGRYIADLNTVIADFFSCSACCRTENNAPAKGEEQVQMTTDEEGRPICVQCHEMGKMWDRKKAPSNEH